MKITQAIEKHLDEFKKFHKAIVMEHVLAEITGKYVDENTPIWVYYAYVGNQGSWYFSFNDYCIMHDTIKCSLGDFLDIDCSQDILSQLKTIEHYWEVS